jgi:putative heme-binding domain-containing protein
VLPERYLNRNPHLAVTESLADIIEPGDTGRVFPLAPPPLTFNDESVKNFNALAGLTIYRGSALGKEYRGNAFAGESLLNLVHRRVLESNGVTFVARRGEQEKEFLASTDPWFHPVNFATGPDGALYVVDFYRRFVEHPDFVHGKARNEVPWREGAGHGRIWRVRDSKSQISNRKVALSRATWSELVEHLGDDNGWWRDTAQRLLVERQERAAIPALEKLARAAVSPLARLHALHTLQGLHAMRPEILLIALKDSHPGVREHAVQLSEPLLKDEQAGPLRAAIVARAEDSDVRVRFQAGLSLGELNGDAKLDALSTIARRDFASRWHQLAVLSSTGPKAWPLLKKLSEEEPGWLDSPTSEQAKFLDQLARLIGAEHSEADLGECLTMLTKLPAGPTASGRLAVLAGLADGLARTPEPLRKLISNPPESLDSHIRSLATLVDIAITRAISTREKLSDRLDAIRILARVTPELSGKALLDLLQPPQPGEVQSAAARGLADLDSPALAKTIFGHWSQYAAATRRRVLAAVPRSTALTVTLADALEGSEVAAVELDASVRQTLLKTSNDQLKQRFQRLLTNAIAPDRQEVVSRFQPSLKLEGNCERGAAIFVKTCLVCHTVQGQGRHVGPDLSGIGGRPKEALLVDILDPSRQVSPDFINYTLTTTDGKLLTGFILSETAASVTLRRAGEADDTVLRSQIKDLRADGKSLMPEGLEQGLTPKDMADLLAFLQKPEGRLLSEVK